MKQKRGGISDFRKIPGGAGGVEHRLSLLYTYGVLAGRISLNRMVELFASGPARIFGLYPRKGEILPGSDADLVIYNPGTESIISAKSHHQNCDSNIYEGIPVRGNADYVIAGGRIIIDEGKMTSIEKSGKYLFRSIN
jgi:dihydropyrimidinase